MKRTTKSKSPPLTAKDCIRYFTLMGLSVDEIAVRLDWLELPYASRFLISHNRSELLSTLRFLKKIGMLSGKKPVIPSRLKELSEPEAEPLTKTTGSHYGRQSRDD